MKRCIIIGGGFAGLTASVYLSQYGFNVEIIEAAPKPGGRAYSFKDIGIGSSIDNGQHIMMGCYRETLKLFKIIGAEENLIYQKKLNVNFLKESTAENPAANGKPFRTKGGLNVLQLKAFPMPYPLNILLGLLNYRALYLKDRLILLKFFLKLPFISISRLINLSVYDWLIRENQNENIRKAFWDILAVGALNTNTKKASAETFAFILKEMFLKGNKAATIILPKFSLSETYCKNAVEFIEEHNGKINLLESVLNLKISDNILTEIETTRRILTDFDFVISTVPLYSLKKIYPQFKSADSLFLEYSCILSIHIWLKYNRLEEDFYGFIDSPVHWIFNHQDYLTLVISDANALIEKSKEEIFEIALNQLEKFVNIKKDQIRDYKIIKEKRATFVPSPSVTANRPEQKTALNNFFLAGDWVNTGLPSTIESAVKSGRIAAEMVFSGR